MSCQKKQCCKIKEDYLVCTCMEVMYSQIIQAIKDGAHTLETLSDQLGVGTGCSSCIDEINDILATALDKK
jgi:bacterioferritin-associated ferredoxin